MSVNLSPVQQDALVEQEHLEHVALHLSAAQWWWSGCLYIVVTVEDSTLLMHKTNIKISKWITFPDRFIGVLTTKGKPLEFQEEIYLETGIMNLCLPFNLLEPLIKIVLQYCICWQHNTYCDESNAFRHQSKRRIHIKD
jgi:hypothetical protein